MINIMFINRRLDTIGGEERSISLLCNELVKNESYNITIVCLSGTTAAFPFDEKIKIVFLQEYHKKKVSKLYHLVKMIQQNGYQLVVGYGVQTIYYAGIIGYICKLPVVYYEVMNPYTKLLNTSINWYPLRTKIKWFIGKRLLYRRNAVFQSHMAMSYYRKLNKCVVISNILDSEALPDINDWVARENKVVSAARYSPEKGLPLLIEAFVIAHKSNPGYVLDIYGEGKQKEKLVRLVNRYKANEYIKIKPFFNDIRDIFDCMNRAKIYVCSSISEGFSYSMLESMAMGMVPISTNCSGSVEDLIEDGVNGLVVPVRYTEAMSKALVKLMENDTLAEEMAANAVKVRESNAKEKIIHQWIDFFDEVIEDYNIKHMEQITR